MQTYMTNYPGYFFVGDSAHRYGLEHRSWHFHPSLTFKGQADIYKCPYSRNCNKCFLNNRVFEDFSEYGHK